MKRIIFVLLSLLLLSLAACGAEEGAKPAGSARDPYEDYNNRFMVRGAPEGPLQWVETEDYYFIGYKYYDKKTEECEFYCARPDCMHEDETCDACKGVLGIYGGKLYFIAAIDKNHSGIFTQNLDGTERKLVRPFTDDEQLQQGKVYFHRGILYCFLNESYIDNGAPKSHLRLMAIDPNKDDSRVLFEEVEYPGAWGWVFFQDDLLYLLLDFRIPDDAEEYAGLLKWELWTYDIDTDEMTLTCSDHTTNDILHGAWITDEGEIYTVIETEFRAEREEDWTWYYSLAKLEDGKFVKLWDTDKIEGLYDGTPQVSDGTVVTQYCDNFLNNPNVRFITQDFEGNVIADGYLPYPYDAAGEDGFEFERYTIIWATEDIIWVQFHLQKPLVYEDHTTFAPMTLAVRYDIIDGGYSLSFAEPPTTLYIGTSA